MKLLTSPDLIERIAADFSRAGIVGERTNALMGYLAAVSRKLDRPLALLLQSTSRPANPHLWMRCSPSCRRRIGSCTRR